MSADEMFKELGYERNKSKEFIIYSKKEMKYNKTKKWEICLVFNCIDKCLMVKNKQLFSLEELQAINKKVEELGWMK